MRAKTLLAQYGIVPEEIRIDREPTKRDEMLTRTGGMRTVPQIFIGDGHVGGFDQLSALHTHGVLGKMLAE